MLHVDGVKANNGDESNVSQVLVDNVQSHLYSSLQAWMMFGTESLQSDICLRKRGAKIIRAFRLLRQMLLGTVQGFEQGLDIALIGISFGGEA